MCRKARRQRTVRPRGRGDGHHHRLRADGHSDIRIRREVKGRKGKTVTTISGFDLDDNALNLLSKQLKQHCGTGGSVKDGVVIIQGDHRDTIKGLLEGQGYLVKLAGG